MLDILHNITSVGWTILEFMVFTVFIKLIFAKWVAEKVKKWLVTANKRNAAIWDHYHQNHKSESVLECTEESCQVFREDATRTAAVPVRAS